MSGAEEFVRKGMRNGGIIGGLTGAAAGAAAMGLPKTFKNSRGQTSERSTKQRLTSAAVGAAGLGFMGHATGQAVGGLRSALKWNSGFRPQAPLPDWLKGAKTKSEARKLYHQQSRKAHPDLGGSTEAQSRLNEEWSKHAPFFKEAMLLGFADELEKLATWRNAAR